MKSLILSQCYLTTEAQGRLLAVCLELAQQLNPGYDILLIDNASPLDPIAWCSGLWKFAVLANVMPLPILGGGRMMARFTQSIGHFSHKFTGERDPSTARDGPGRAIMTGLQIAMNSGYDRLVSLESDCLFARPFDEGFAMMTKAAAMLPRTKHGYLETNVMWFNDLKWLKEYNLIGRYDWPNQTPQTQRPGREGERIYEEILGSHLQVLPYKGGRGEGYTNAQNLTAIYPEGIDFLTHVSRETFARFLELNGHGDLGEKL